ncbi:MAG: hypothetical protein ACI8TX_001163 [Hyphomicrobiaceae bacterium]|jgi:hypothetical protein
MRLACVQIRVVERACRAYADLHARPERSNNHPIDKRSGGWGRSRGLGAQRPLRADRVSLMQSRRRV